MLLAHLTLAASAHILMDSPDPVTTLLKTGPCGDGPHVRGTNIFVFEPGETITVEWHETINHPSTFRISFDEDGDDSFADPASYTDYYTNETVLVDAIPDETDLDYSIDVTLPDVACETCTLQLIQVMTDKPPYAPGTNDLYYQCADLALRAAATPSTGDTGTTPTTPTTTPTTTDDTDLPTTGGTTPTDPATDDTATGSDEKNGCGCAASGPAPVAGLLSLLLVLRRRR